MKLEYPLIKSNIFFPKLELLYNQILPNYNNVIHNKVSKLSSTTIEIDYNNKDQRFLYYNKWLTNFLDHRLAEIIFNKYRYVSIEQFKYNTNSITISVYTTNGQYNSNSLLIKIMKCFILIDFLKLKNEDIHISYVPLDNKKTLWDGDDLLPYNFNSGYTNINHIGDICIFRKEESDKVFLHELIHYLGLDFAGKYDYSIEQHLLDNTQVDKNGNLFESYTDSYAIILNSIFNCYFTNSNIHEYIYSEIMWQQKVVSHICKHMGFKNIDDIFIINTNKKFKQETSVFTYYILKLGVFMNVDEFLTLFPINKIKWTVKNQLKYYMFTLGGIKQINMNDSYKYKYNFKHNKKSVRMTYNELVI